MSFQRLLVSSAPPTAITIPVSNIAPLHEPIRAVIGQVSALPCPALTTSGIARTALPYETAVHRTERPYLSLTPETSELGTAYFTDQLNMCRHHKLRMARSPRGVNPSPCDIARLRTEGVGQLQRSIQRTSNNPTTLSTRNGFCGSPRVVAALERAELLVPVISWRIERVAATATGPRARLASNLIRACDRTKTLNTVGAFFEKRTATKTFRHASIITPKHRAGAR